MADTVILDVDGTLVDSTYHHALAWARAFARLDLAPPMWRVHRAIGMGGDHLVTEVMGEQVEAEHGDELRAASKEEFRPLRAEVRALDGAVELLQELRRRGFRLVLASSGSPDDVDFNLSLLDGKKHADAWTSSQDVQATKPEPDLVGVAMEKAGAQQAVMIGDAPWDVVAAGRLGLTSYGLRTGGFAAAELTEAGAARVFDSLVELRDSLDDTALARAGSQG